MGARDRTPATRHVLSLFFHLPGAVVVRRTTAARPHVVGSATDGVVE